MIILMGHLQLDPADVHAFTDDIDAVAASTRAEAGCLFHALVWEDARVGRMLVVQRWRDQAALDAHFTKPATIAFLQKWGARMRGDMLKYDAANERSLA